MRPHLSLVLNNPDIRSDGDRDEPGCGFHVLVIDGEEFSARLKERLLVRAGFTVTVVADAAAARLLFARAPVDAVVSDVAFSARRRVPWIIALPHPIDDAERERATDDGAAAIAATGDIVDGVLEGLWESGERL